MSIKLNTKSLFFGISLFLDISIDYETHIIPNIHLKILMYIPNINL